MQDQLKRETPIMGIKEAFSKEELDWFSQFERDVDLWRAVDVLFPDKKVIY